MPSSPGENAHHMKIINESNIRDPIKGQNRRRCIYSGNNRLMREGNSRDERSGTMRRAKREPQFIRSATRSCQNFGPRTDLRRSCGRLHDWAAGSKAFSSSYCSRNEPGDQHHRRIADATVADVIEISCWRELNQARPIYPRYEPLTTD